MTKRHVRHTARTLRATRTARSAGLLAVAAVAALSLTACQTGGDDGAAGARTKVSASAPASEAGGNGASAQTVARSEAPTGDRTTAPAAAGGTTTTSGTTSKAVAAPIRTVTLVDGSKAEVYRVGTQRYQAKIVNNGDLLATLDTKKGDDGLDANGMYVVLTMGGEVRSWMGGEHQGPGTFTLAGGWKAKVTKVGELHYRAQIIGREGAVEATMDANQHDTGLDANAVYIVLSAGGVISSHA
ncbi:hypothetical protein ELQ87_20285 [Streptomyces griseoviridis]|uniref:Lipoprotein n=1 Tax=Streptomyces griseoviridis TaxID=45398 RepID=A0A3S9ZFJ1_STRGD|nr:hypothetical protein [Streptomyces griseoviridis]AZS86337.1 hypothetical protein ELQ87_20285 [Streptomyces griseoviridis]QCN86799.1 hypothetical protein DDJ31_19000 [Streptomyces griseoviridis]